MSGSSVGSVLGAAIGYALAIPTGGLSVLAGAQWGLMIGGVVGGALMPANTNGPKLGEAQSQTSQAGVPRPWVLGHPAPFAGNLIDGETKARKRKRKTQQGKGGPTSTEQYFLLTSAIRICEAIPNGGILRVWEDGVCVYDARTTFPPGWTGYDKEARAAQAKFLQRATFYLGGESQLPDPSLEAIHGVGNTPYYRGTCYMVVRDVESRDGTAKRYQFEVTAGGTVVPYAPNVPAFMGNLLEWFTFDNTPYGSVNTGLLWSNFFGGGAVHAYSTSSKTSKAMLSVVSKANVGSYAYGQALNTAILAYIDCSADTHPTHPVIIGFGDNNGQTGDTGYNTIEVRVSGGVATANARMLDAAAPVQVYLRTTPVPLRANAENLFGFTYDPATHVTTFYVNGVASGTVTFYGTGHPAGVAWYYLTYEQEGTSGYPGAFASVTQVKVDEWGTWSQVVMTADDWAYLYNNGLFRSYLEATTGLPPTVSGIVVPDSPGSYYDYRTREITTTDPLDTITSDSVTLQYAEEAIAARCNVPAGKIDCSALSAVLLPGLLVAEQHSGADVLSPLMNAFFHDLPEYDGLGMVARLRGGATVLSITDDDLLDASDDEPNTRPQEIEFPAKVTVITQDPDADWAPIPSTSSRYSLEVEATSEFVLQLPIPFRADARAQIADKLHKLLWNQAEARRELILSEEFSRIIPSDAIDYDNRRWLVREANFADGVQRLKMDYERASSYGSQAVGQPVPEPTPPTTNVRGPTLFAAMNLPQLRPRDNVTGVYITAQGLFSGYLGADIYLSTDGGLTFNLVEEITQFGILGEVAIDEPPGGEPITVQLYDPDDALENVTTAQVDLGQNLAAILDADGVAELISFEQATETSGGDWELETLTRGRLRTPTQARVEGEAFVLLNAPYFLPIPAELAGTTLIFRPVSKGTTVDENPTYSMVFDPYTPRETFDYITNSGEPYVTVSNELYYGIS